MTTNIVPRRVHGQLISWNTIAVHRGLCAQLLPVRAGQELAAVPQHQEHHPEAVRWQVQGHLPGPLRQVRRLSNVERI
jgi:hypothetical protein